MKTKKYILLATLGMFLLFSCNKPSEEPEVSEVAEVPATPETPEVTEAPEQTLLFSYPEKGKYGLNILAEDFVEAKRKEDGSGKLVDYSVRAVLPEGNSSLKIVIKSANPTLYYTFIGVNQGSDFNWVFSTNADNHLILTYVNELVHVEGKVADLSIAFVNDCIVEYYENGAETPTKVKEIKVIK